MRSVVQRVTEASVEVEGRALASMEHGLVALIGVEGGDALEDARYLADKIVKLRIFSDGQGKMNLSVRDVKGAVMAISQFTLLGDARGQNRPGFVRAEEPQRANELYEACCERIASHGVTVFTGRFGGHMRIALVNDGPVTLLLDSKKTF